MEVLIVDRAHLESVPVGQREDLVEEAAFGPDGAYDYNLPPGWTWPDPTQARRWARYEFLDTMPVQEGQAVQAVTNQDAVHGRGVQAQDRSDAGRAQLAVLPKTAHAGLDRPRRAVRCRARTAGSAVQSLLAFGPPAAHPLVSGDTGDAHLGGDMRDGTSGADTFDKQPPAVNGQPGITVGHEDLRAVQS
ncbi:hypothetical protein BJ965_007698 [Streptomyces luteogriseus]|uniref:Uncharacterized protein n=1 Tax=Streptomyces luteogriseus TaxID=68233 RepID=A0A7W7DVQ8_9ACTN|nr:hypothetical protein [Streptomyces luteogriseus]